MRSFLDERGLVGDARSIDAERLPFELVLCQPLVMARPHATNRRPDSHARSLACRHTAATLTPVGAGAMLGSMSRLLVIGAVMLAVATSASVPAPREPTTRFSTR